MKPYFALVLSGLLWGALGDLAMAGDEIQFKGKAYKRITGKALQQATRGQLAKWDIKNFSEGFYKDGSYSLSGPLAPTRGQYRILTDKVCVRFNDSKDEEKCFALFKASDGEYVRMQFVRDKKTVSQRIFIEPLNE